MSIWGKVVGIVVGGSFAGPFGAITGAVVGHYIIDHPMNNEVAFTIALIALSAKMAKADGVVSPSEIQAFYDICHVQEREQKNVERVYRLAQEDTAGFEAYAQQVVNIFEKQPRVYEEVLDGLFYIAYADGNINSSEELFLRRVAEIFKIKESVFLLLHARHNTEIHDPYKILGVTPNMSDKEIKKVYLRMVCDYHPDQIQARGVPQEIMHLANQRMAIINTAWYEIQEARDL